MPVVKIPSPMRQFAGGRDSIDAQGSTVAEVLQSVTEQFPDLKDRVYEADGEVRRFLNLYVNEEDVRFLDELATKVEPGDVVDIIANVAGG